MNIYKLFSKKRESNTEELFDDIIGYNNIKAVGITKTDTTGLMKFALSPLNATTQIATSSDIPTKTGSIHAALSRSPNPLAANTQSTLKEYGISFPNSILIVSILITKT
jgi:hypothetical protein